MFILLNMDISFGKEMDAFWEVMCLNVMATYTRVSFT